MKKGVGAFKIPHKPGGRRNSSKKPPGHPLNQKLEIQPWVGLANIKENHPMGGWGDGKKFRNRGVSTSLIPDMIKTLRGNLWVGEGKAKEGEFPGFWGG